MAGILHIFTFDFLVPFFSGLAGLWFLFGRCLTRGLRESPPPLFWVSDAFEKVKLFRFYNLHMQKLGPKESDTYKTAYFLSKVIPKDVVPVIMDMAKFWVDCPLAYTVHDLEAAEKDAGTIYLMTELPQSFPATGLRSLTFTVTSRDQGWSWDLQWHGTLRNSYTWFEALVIPPDAEETIRPGDTKTHLTGKKIITNIHAGQGFESQDIRWTLDDNDEEVVTLLRSIRGGTKIAITAWARYPKWVNSVRSARIDCQVNAVRKM